MVRFAKTSIQCDKCDKSFCNASNLKRHMVQIHKVAKPFKCNFCDEGFDFKWRLKAHMAKDHKTITALTKPEVEKQQSSKCYIQSEMSLSAQIVYLSTPPEVLEEINLKLESLQNHIDIESKPENKSKKIATCDICDKDFSSRGTLRRHLRDSHESKKASFRCDECGISCSRKDALSKHIQRKHSL